MERKRNTFKLDLDIDLNFWALLPALNINVHSKELEFEWLCFGVYLKKSDQITINNATEKLSDLQICDLIDIYERGSIVHANVPTDLNILVDSGILRRGIVEYRGTPEPKFISYTLTDKGYAIIQSILKK